MSTLFDRRAIKERAKQNLKNHYWLSLAVVALIGALGGGITVPHFNANFTLDDNDFSFSNPFVHRIMDHLYPILPILIVVGSVVLLIAITVAVLKTYFVTGPFTVGMTRYFLGLTRGEAKFKNIVHGFTCGHYKNVCKTMFRMMLYLFLWALLYLIPIACIALGMVLTLVFHLELIGVIVCIIGALAVLPSLIPVFVKTYEYSMIPYVLSEHPQMDTDEVFAVSKQLTMGHKWHLFVLALSFLGWELLGLLCCGIGLLFVEPYILAAEAEAYVTLCQLQSANTTQMNYGVQNGL